MLITSPTTAGEAMDNLRKLDENIRLHSDSPISRARVSARFGQETPRHPNLTYEVFEQTSNEVRKDIATMSMLELYIQTLRSPGFEQALVEEIAGFTMAKPNIGKALYQRDAVPESQEEALIEEIRRAFREGVYKGIKVETLAPASLVMTPGKKGEEGKEEEPGTFEKFYAMNKERQLTIPIQESALPSYVWIPADKNLYRGVESVMTSGPTTPMIVYSRDGNVLEKFRGILGSSNPTAERDLEKFAGTYRVQQIDLSLNTGIHGSGIAKPPQERTAEVKHETGWYADGLENLMTGEIS